MKKLSIALLIAGLMLSPVSAYADAGEIVKTYVVSPIQWTHRAVWGAATLLFKVGKAPVDKVLELIGTALKTTPNEPLWQ